MNDAFEGTDDAGDDLVEFTCPYNCGKPIRMKERNVIKNKCTDCRSHLLKCDGVRADGQKAACGSISILHRGCAMCEMEVKWITSFICGLTDVLLRAGRLSEKLRQPIVRHPHRYAAS